MTTVKSYLHEIVIVQHILIWWPKSQFFSFIISVIMITIAPVWRNFGVFRIVSFGIFLCFCRTFKEISKARRDLLKSTECYSNLIVLSIVNIGIVTSCSVTGLCVCRKLQDIPITVIEETNLFVYKIEFIKPFSRYINRFIVQLC